MLFSNDFHKSYKDPRPLPDGFEFAETEDGREYFVNNMYQATVCFHRKLFKILSTKKNSWTDPRPSLKLNDTDEILVRSSIEMRPFTKSE